MYEQFFRLSELPFGLGPDPRFLWLSETHQEGLSAVVYGVGYRKGFVLLSGEVGAGKTTLLRAALEQLEAEFPEPIETGMILHTANLSALDLLKLVAAEFGAAGRLGTAATTADYLLEITGYLIERMRCGLNTVLIIDEAQNLSFDALEQVRLLSNVETTSEKALQIVLTGQPELRTTLADHRLRQLRQRIAISHHVESLALREVGSYLRHRLGVAGGRFEDIFDDSVEGVFADFSGGCPRMINMLADRALLSAYLKGLRRVPRALVELKAKEMREELGRGREELGGHDRTERDPGEEGSAGRSAALRRALASYHEEEQEKGAKGAQEGSMKPRPRPPGDR